MKISVIGGSGFVGKHLVDCLKKKDIVASSHDSKSFDLINSKTWGSLDKNCDLLILAAGTIDNGERAYVINSQPIEELCSFLQKTKVKKIIYLSSGAVYGNYDEALHPGLKCNPISDYAKSKLLAEESLQRYWSRDLNILRLFFPYGNDQKLPRFLPKMIEKIKKGEPIQCGEDGGPILTLSHVEDLSEAIVQDFVLKEAQTQVTNMASHYSVSIKELCLELAKYLGIEPFFSYSGEPKNCYSLPYPFEWNRTGIFHHVFQ